MSRVNLLLKPVLCISTIDFITSRNKVGNYSNYICLKFFLDDITLCFQQDQDINDCFRYREIEFLMMNSDSVSKPTSGLLYNVHVTVNPACPI